MHLSIVLPCLNEEQTLPDALALAHALLQLYHDDGEIIVADNGSSDHSRDIATAAGAHVIPVAQRGYGYALQAGIHAARGRVIVMGDADATYLFPEAKTLVDAVDAGADLAMGSRLRGAIAPGAMPFLHHYLGTPVLSALIRLFFRLPISDCNCGMRAFSKDAFLRMKLRCGGMEFASEMLVKAALEHLTVVEFPISLAKDKRTGKPHLNTWHDGWRHLRFILLFAPHILFTLPGWILTIAFGLFTLALSFGPLHIGHTLFDFHHLFYSIPLFCLGSQLLWCAGFVDHFRRFSALSQRENRPPRPFRLERALLIGGTLLLAGLTLFACVFLHWWNSGRAGLLAIRPCALALTLFLSGMTSCLNAFLLSMLELNLLPHSKE